jgi:hypothetical protein
MKVLVKILEIYARKTYTSTVLIQYLQIKFDLM